VHAYNVCWNFRALKLQMNHKYSITLPVTEFANAAGLKAKTAKFEMKFELKIFNASIEVYNWCARASKIIAENQCKKGILSRKFSTQSSSCGYGERVMSCSPVSIQMPSLQILRPVLRVGS